MQRAGVNERFTNDSLNGEWAGACLPVRHYAGQLAPYRYEFSPGANRHPLSEWVDVNGRRVGLACLGLALPGGERLGLVPFEPAQFALPLLQPARAAQWAALCEWVSREALPVRVVQGWNVVPQLHSAPYAREGLLTLANLSSDRQNVRLAGAWAAPGNRFERLEPDGTWTPLAALDPISLDPWSLTAFTVSAL